MSTAGPHPWKRRAEPVNVGDGLAVDVNGGASTDGTILLAWDQHPANAGQHWAAGQYTLNGGQAWAFLNRLNTAEALTEDLSSHAAILQHCAGACATNQVWWFGASGIDGAVYLHNGQTNNCLTDHGSVRQLTIEPCVTGNKAQLWETP